MARYLQSIISRKSRTSGREPSTMVQLSQPVEQSDGGVTFSRSDGRHIS